MRYLDADAVSAFGPAAALRAITDALRAGLDPAADPARLGPGDLIPMRDVATGTVRPPTGRPLVFKSVGMSWEDLVVAEATHSSRR